MSEWRITTFCFDDWEHKIHKVDDVWGINGNIFAKFTAEVEDKWYIHATAAASSFPSE